MSPLCGCAAWAAAALLLVTLTAPCQSRLLEEQSDEYDVLVVGAGIAGQ